MSSPFYIVPLMPEQWTALYWCLAVLGAILVGMSKAGFGGVGMLFVLLLATIMPARTSTGFVLPLLIFADVFAVRAFNKHADWGHVKRLIPPALIGIILAFLAMQRIDDKAFRPVIGWIVLVLCAVQMLRSRREEWFEQLPESHIFSGVMGFGCGFTTMLANAAGPVATLYLLASRLPKMEFVGTGAWFFLLVNLFKVPFSWQLGLINLNSLRWNVLLTPAVLCGVFAGKWLLERIPQKMYENLLLAFTIVAAVKLILP